MHKNRMATRAFYTQEEVAELLDDDQDLEEIFFPGSDEELTYQSDTSDEEPNEEAKYSRRIPYAHILHRIHLASFPHSCNQEFESESDSEEEEEEK